MTSQPSSPPSARLDGRARTGAQSVERAISVLYAFEGETRPLSISEIAGRVGLPVSTAHRIASALVRGRLLARDGHNSYVIGDGVTALAHAASSRIDIDAMAPHLHLLASEIRITASLGIVEDNEAVTVYSARPPSMFCDHQLPDRRARVEDSAMGQAIVAFGHRRERQSSTLAGIGEARRRGYSVATAEGVTAVAVPVFGADGHVRASIGVQARSVRLEPGLITAITPSMRQTAATLRDLADLRSTGS